MPKVKTRDKCAAMQTRGEIYALSAAYQQSISLYSQALRRKYMNADP